MRYTVERRPNGNWQVVDEDLQQYVGREESSYTAAKIIADVREYLATHDKPIAIPMIEPATNDEWKEREKNKGCGPLVVMSIVTAALVWFALYWRFG